MAKAQIAENNATKTRFILFIFVFSLAAIFILISTFASGSKPSVAEAEYLTAANDCVEVISDQTATNSQAVELGCSTGSGSGFVHPGILVTEDQLDFVRDMISSNKEPWATAFTRARTDGGTTKTSLRNATYDYSALNYPPAPVSAVECSSNGVHRVGCSEIIDDSVAAYTHALMWSYTGNTAHAEKTVEILNAWADNLNIIRFKDASGSPTYNNGLLIAAWAGQLQTRAAEIVRYTYSGWSQQDIQKYEDMLVDKIYNLTKDLWSSSNNWISSMIDAHINIGVFTNNQQIFNDGIANWRKYAPTYIYLESDGPLPVPPGRTASEQNYWSDPTRLKNTVWWGTPSFTEGQQVETCRDMSHTMLGMGGMSSSAETARIQGIDLFGEEKNRIIAGYETNASYVIEALNEIDRRGGADPASSWKPSNNWVCPSFKLAGNGFRAGWEIAYNHYANRDGSSLPNTKQVVERLRPAGYGLHMMWETLTHANTGEVQPEMNGTLSGFIESPEAGNYRVWVRLSGQQGINSVDLKIDQSKYNYVAQINSNGSSWVWSDIDSTTNQKMNVTLPEGPVDINISGLNPGVKVDRIIISKPDCIPVGGGENCEYTPPPPEPEPDNASFEIEGLVENETYSQSISVGTVPIDVRSFESFDYYIDDQFINSQINAPYCLLGDNGGPCFDYDISNLSNGVHVVKVVMNYDGKQIVKSVNIIVDNFVPDITAPQISILSPNSGSIVSDTVQIAAEVEDESNITSVEFYMNSSLIGKDTIKPYTVNWDSKSVTNGSYNLVVKATDDSNNQSEKSQTIIVSNAPPPDTSPPTSPNPLSAILNTDGTISLSWPQSTDNVAVAGYQIVRTGDGTSELIETPFSVTSYIDGDVYEGNTYQYIVRAYDEAGNTSNDSDQVSVIFPVPPDTTPPSAPGNIQAGVSELSVSLAWQPSSDNDGVKNYIVYRNSQPIASTDKTTFIDNTILYDMDYEYTVQAVDNSGNKSELSDKVSVSVEKPPEPDTQAPTTPSTITAEAVSKTQINLSWKASMDNEAVSGYKVFRDGEEIADVIGLSIADASLEPDTEYSYQVVAYDAAGNASAPSQPVLGTTESDEQLRLTTITGRVVDSETEQGIRRARAIIYIGGSKYKFKASTTGEYFIPDVALGTYSIKFKKRNLGYIKRVVEVDVNQSPVYLLNVSLDKAR